MNQKNKKNKILFVIPLYGKEITGGAEWHCRQIAERLVDTYEVEVATTKSRYFTSWSDYYTESTESINGVMVRRFNVKALRDKNHILIEQLVRADPTDHEMFLHWLRSQGPDSPDMIKFIGEHQAEYYKIIVFQYLYATSYFAIDALPSEKVIFVPLTHDEPIAYLHGFTKIYKKSGYIVFNTESERRLVHKLHFINDKEYMVIGAGVDYPTTVDASIFTSKYNLDQYLIFLGRIEPSKNIDLLIDYFSKFKVDYPSNLKLVLAGEIVKPPKKCKDVLMTGYIDRAQKFAAIKGAIALINPSEFESLSLIVLESFFMQRPVIVNGKCDVTRTHVIESNGGLWFENYDEFKGTIRYLLEHSQGAEQMGKNGYEYAANLYTWDIVMKKWREVLGK